MAVSQRQATKFARDFQLFAKIRGFSQTGLQLIFSKVTAGRPSCSLREFIEILFKIAKLTVDNPGRECDGLFRRFIEEHLVPCYRRINLTSLELNVDNVQVFYKGQNPYENPVVSLLFHSDDLLKHVKFSLPQPFLTPARSSRSTRPMISRKARLPLFISRIS